MTEKDASFIDDEWKPRLAVDGMTLAERSGLFYLNATKHN